MSVNAPPTGNPYVDIGIAAATYLAQSLGSREQGLNAKQRRELEQAGWTKLGGGRGWQSPTGQTVRNRDQLRREWRALGAGPSAADRMPAPQASPVPVYAPIFATVFGMPSPKRATQADVRKALERLQRRDLEAWLKRPKWARGASIAKARGREALAVLRKQAPRIAAPILKRVPKGAGPIVAAQVAYTVGFEIGSAIYRAWDRYKYGSPAPAQPGAPGVPGRGPQGRRSPAAPPSVPAPTIGRAPRTVPRSQTVARSQTNARAAPAAPAVPAPVIAPVSVPVPARVPAPARSTLTVPRIAQALGLATLAVAGARRSSSASPKQVTASQVQPLTAFNAPPLGLSPQVRTRECKCEPKRRKSGAQRCRNPVTRRTKRTRGGQQFITITRRVEC